MIYTKSRTGKNVAALFLMFDFLSAVSETGWIDEYDAKVHIVAVFLPRFLT